MEYKKSNSKEYNPKVKDIQNMLNRSRQKALAIINERNQEIIASGHIDQGVGFDKYYFQTVHHRDNVKSNWPILEIDGHFGNKTEIAVKCLQHFLFITENGIMGQFTYEAMKNLLILKTKHSSIIYGDVPTKQDEIHNTLYRASAFIDDTLINFWGTAVSPANAFMFFIGQGYIVVLEKMNENLTLHVNLKQIVKDLLLPENSRKGKWVHINCKTTFRDWKAFKIYKNLSIGEGKYSSMMRNWGVAGCVVETVDLIGKTIRKEVKFVDVARAGFDFVSTSLDVALKDVVVQKLTVKEAVIKYGNAIGKWKFAAKLSGGTLVAGGVAVVCFQCVGAFLAGWEIGNIIEKKTHIGETAVDFYWDLFLGDIFEKVIEWNINRVVCIQYPKDWSEGQIQEFQRKFK